MRLRSNELKMTKLDIAAMEKAFRNECVRAAGRHCPAGSGRRSIGQEFNRQPTGEDV